MGEIKITFGKGKLFYIIWINLQPHALTNDEEENCFYFYFWH